MNIKENEVVVRVSDLFASILKAAKPILCIALALALLGGLWGAYKTIDAAKHPSVTEDDIKAAENNVTNAENCVVDAEKSLDRLYEIEIPDAETRTERARQLVQRRREYIDNSLYYAMNPFHRGVARATLFVDTDTEISPDSPWMSVNPQSSIVIAATRMYPFDSDILENIQRIMGTEADLPYISELVSVSNVSNQFIEICVYFDDAEIARQVADYLIDTLQSRLTETVGDYTAKVVSYFVGYEVDWGMNDSHNSQDDSLLSAERSLVSTEEALQAMKTDTVDARKQAIEDAKTAVADANQFLEDTKAQFANTSADPINVLKQALIKALILFIVGFALACAAVAVIRILSGKIQDIAGVLNRYAFPLIGVLPGKKNRWFEKSIRKLEGETQIDFESAGKAAAQSLFSLVGSKKIAFVSTEGIAAIEQILPFFDGHVPVCGDVLKDAEAVKKLDAYDGLVLVEQRGKSRMDYVDSEVRLIRSLGKQIEGLILL